MSVAGQVCRVRNTVVVARAAGRGAAEWTE
jgi:hypothetical protein